MNKWFDFEKEQDEEEYDYSMSQEGEIKIYCTWIVCCQCKLDENRE